MEGAGPSSSGQAPGVGLPWDAAALGDLDFAEHLLVFAEEDPRAAAAKLEADRAEAARLQKEALENQRQGAATEGEKSGSEAQARNKRPISEISGANDTVKDESSDFAANKACREKARRCRLNDRFAELANLLEEPSHIPRTDKASILQAAITAVTNLRREIGQLRQLNKYLEDRVGQYEKERGMHMYQQMVSYGQPGAGHGMVQTAPTPQMQPVAPQSQTVYQIVQPAGAPPPQSAFGTVSVSHNPTGHAQPMAVHPHHMQPQPSPLQPQPQPQHHAGAMLPLKPHMVMMQQHSMASPSYSMVPHSTTDASQDASLRPPVA